ncbi:MAG: hypothetical protein AAF065_05520 [Verrucomicrobiota bacterium]
MANPVKTEELVPEVNSAIGRQLPIGTIVASMLPAKDFSELAGDDGSFDPVASYWVPADGRLVAGSKYAQKIKSNIPDLRGIFLRGLNHSEAGSFRNDDFADPDNTRTAGSYQGDAMEKHSHKYDGYSRSHRAGGGSDNESVPRSGTQKSSTPSGSSTETRPVNAAVYYYIKIN